MAGDANRERTVRLSIWSWPAILFALLGPLLVIGAAGLIVHLARPSSGTMFDDDNFGGTFVGLAASIIGLVSGYFITRSAVRDVALRGPCPGCGVVAIREFENPKNLKSWPTACGTCIAYLRANGDEMCEEALETSVWLFYKLSADQYKPAVKRTNRDGFRFDMPTMCASCGDPNAHDHRDIADGDHFGKDWTEVGYASPRAGMAPGTNPPTEDDKNSKGLSHLKVSVCAKHTRNADPSDDVLKYSSGKLEFRSYRYYKAFCELNHITRATAKRRG
jgi:hypothetical protein